MGGSVGRLRNNFYQNLRREYQKEEVNSFLYRYFWTESVMELIEKYFPHLSNAVPPENGAQIRALLKKEISRRRDLLLREVPGEDRKGRRDFWTELWLNDAGYQAGLISDTDYYLWLVEYLAAHDIYYKDTGIWDVRLWLDTLLKRGLDWREGMRVPGEREQANKKVVFRMAQITDDLRELAERIRTNRAAVAGRLHNLEEGGEDYLPQLTAQLAQMALHIKIKNWLQNSGYPLTRDKKAKTKPSARKLQKQDFTLRMFEAYCRSGRGGHFLRQDQDAGRAGSSWHLDEYGFCVLDAGQQELEALLAALEQEEEDCFYLPLAVDPRSGCVFFLAGKEVYRRGYMEEEAVRKKICERARKKLEDATDKKAATIAEKAYRNAKDAYIQAKKAREAYENSPAFFCFDYLRLDGEHLRQFPWDVGGAFRLRSKFLENERKSYQDVLEDFEWYCIDGDDREPGGGSPREAVRTFNQDVTAPIPEPFRWAFNILESREPSPGAKATFDQLWSRSLDTPRSP